ncbi:MAG TPA: TonB C-terminal domain-containing protein [Kofleriaceae bacterium]|jgi:outer membrane biosynthesis protein TonB
MSLSENQMHAVSGILTVVLSVALFVPAVFLTKKAEAHKPILSDDMESIEASVAYKKSPKKQPQKKIRAPDPVVKPEGVSHDDKKKPLEPKPDEPKPKKPDDVKDPFAAAGHHDNPDDPAGKPTEEPGDFNGNEFGWASETKGHPYFQKFAQDIHDNFNFPSISQANTNPVGCFHLSADGKIVDTTIKEHSDSADLDRAASDAIDAVKKLRNATPVPVPTELLGAINRWICFRFNPNVGH